MQELLKHFHELSLHPTNAQNLKGLILKLAMQGYLSENTTNWKKTVLSSVGDWAIGSGFPKKEQGQQGLEILFSKVSDMNLQGNEKYIFRTNNTISREKAQELKVKIHPKGTVVFPKIGGAIATNKRRILVQDTAIDNNCLGILPNKGTTPEWLFLLLSSINFTVYQSGTSVPSLSQKTIGEIEVLWPPEEDQKKLVRIVKELFIEVEALESLTQKRIKLKKGYATSALSQLAKNDSKAKWQTLKPQFHTFFFEVDNIKKLRETILQLAVQGKLTAKWRNRHPELVSGSHHARELLKSIQKEKAQLIKEKKIKKEKALPPISQDEIPYKLPEGWVWCRFGDVITFLNGYAFKSSTYVDLSNYQVIRLGNVKNDKFFINTKEAYVPENIGESTLDYQLYVNDILTTLTGTKDKRDYCYTCLVREEHLNDKVLLLNQRVGCIRAIDKKSSELINKFLKSETILNQLFETESGTANQGNIGSSAFKNLLFPLPSFEEQIVIVQKVNSLMILCDELEQEIITGEQQLEQLMESVLKEVFENKITEELERA